MKRIASLLLAVIIIATGSLYAQRVPMPYAKIQFFDRNGKPLAGGKLWSYVAGTTTPTNTYVSASGAANTNPVVLDSAGRANVWLSSDTSYKFILEDRTCATTDVYGQCHGVQQWSVDSITDYGGLLAAGTSTLAGDVTGAYNASVVGKLQGIAISETDPTEGQVLQYTSGAWTPAAVTLATATQNTFTAAQAVTPATLTVAGDGTIATDAEDSNWFRVTLTTDCPCTLSTPTNPINGQVATWEVIQASGGNETLAYSAAFAFGTVVTSPTITVTASKRDFITATYNSTTSKWYVLYVTQGY